MRYPMIVLPLYQSHTGGEELIKKNNINKDLAEKVNVYMAIKNKSKD